MNSHMEPEVIHVDIDRHSTGTIELSSDFGKVLVNPSVGDASLSKYDDFAVWLMLPVAMRVGKPLRINGSGFSDTLANAQKMSMIWSSWLPNHFRPVEVSFAVETLDKTKEQNAQKSLMFFSGGTDSSGALVRRLQEDKKQDLLTVHGMDYRLNDHDRFIDFINKTDALPKSVGAHRITVKTDVYNLYKRHNVDLPGHHISHIFALAGVGFSLKGYTDYLIAADQRLDHQFMRGPYGSNTATNGLFNDGNRAIVTLDDDITRSDKLAWIVQSEAALDGLSVCDRTKHRPNNCGTCAKCTMMKVLFLARIGHIPEIFIDQLLQKNWHKDFNFASIQKRVHLSDAIYTAKQYGNTNLIPDYHKAEHLFITNAKMYRKKRIRGWIKNYWRKHFSH